MFDRQWLSIPCVGDQDILLQTYLKRIVGRVPVVTLKENMGSVHLWLDQLRKRNESDAFPFHVELAPGRYAVEITGVCKLGQCKKRLPRDASRTLDQPTDLELPLIQRHIRFDAQIQNRKVLNPSLTGRKAILGTCCRLGMAGHSLRPAFLGSYVGLLHHLRSVAALTGSARLAAN